MNSPREKVLFAYHIVDSHVLSKRVGASLSPAACYAHTTTIELEEQDMESSFEEIDELKTYITGLGKYSKTT